MADVVAPRRTRCVAGDTEHRQRLYQTLWTPDNRDTPFPTFTTSLKLNLRWTKSPSARELTEPRSIPPALSFLALLPHNLAGNYPRLKPEPTPTPRFESGKGRETDMKLSVGRGRLAETAEGREVPASQPLPPLPVKSVHTANRDFSGAVLFINRRERLLGFLLQ